ncbi:MAG: MinD/ParA family protein [Synergistaceae bacterium]|nr:MinD/ParA family protein [Synergistaceae bacterium]
MRRYNDNVRNTDQAGELRRMVTDNRQKKKAELPPPRLHTLSILSGKGGVGKSNIAAALSFALADFGKRVVLIDADLGMANLDILCGVRDAKYNIAHLIEGSRNLNEILVHFKTSERATRHNGSVALLPGGYGIREIADLDDYALERLFEALSELEEMSDYLIMDAGAGIHKGALSFAYASEITLLVTTPEPTSIRDAYGVIKSLGSTAWQGTQEGASGVMLIVNMVSSSREALEVAERIRLASMQFLGNAPTYLGYILRDDVIERSVKKCRIFYRSDPDSNAGICVRNLAGDLLRLCEGKDFKHEELHVDNTPVKPKGMKGFLSRLAEKLFADKKQNE